MLAMFSIDFSWCFDLEFDDIQRIITLYTNWYQRTYQIQQENDQNDERNTLKIDRKPRRKFYNFYFTYKSPRVRLVAA